jgi:RNA polymerase sigma-54 factor
VELKQIPYADTDLINQCLQLLQTLDPPGVFARDVRDCLKLQLERKGITGGPVMQIVDGYLNEVASGKISVISRRLKIPTVEVRKCIAQIELLNPRPLLDFTNEKSEFIIPDVIVKWADGEWQIELNDGWIENYHVNSYYLEMLENAEDAELSFYFSEKYKRVRFVMDCIRQRRDTLIRLVSLMVKTQESFFLEGTPLTPVTMSQLAETMEVSVSTVSRAVKGKYIQYPRGSILMKDLFSTAIGNEPYQEKQISSQVIKDKIREFINNEDKENPFSDEQLHLKFKEQGIRISRRAVAKYREELGIKTSYSRKLFSG